MKYAISLISKYGGKSIWLGMKHEDKQAAITYAEKEVCFRCNRAEYWPFEDDWEYVDRNVGFKPKVLQD